MDMTERQRFIATMTFQEPDRVPFEPGGGRESTIAAWRQQGLPPDVDDYVGYIKQLIGFDSTHEATPVQQINPGIVLTMIPEYEQKIIEERPRSRVVQDWKGNICEIGKEFDPSYLRGAPDFVTRSWIKCPVASRDDWPDMARRYDAADASRFPSDFSARADQLRDRTYVSGLWFSGPFWQLREWVGFEGLCMLLLDDPSFVTEMITLWQDFIARMLTRAFEQYVPDFVMVNEDMAYKEKSMISPQMCREFLLPCWQSWRDICETAGVPLYGVDSDGCIDELIPVWLDAGFKWTTPIEVAAGNDLVEFRQRFGTRFAYRGGFDKRAIVDGGTRLRNEMERLEPVIRAGGFIPGCDHGVPADVPWPHFVEYCRLLAVATGWL